MPDFVNPTPFKGDFFGLTTKKGAAFLRIVLKGTFDIAADGRLEPSAEQAEIVMEDQFWGVPGASAVKHESDILIAKPGTDLLVMGEACAPRDRLATQTMVGLKYQGRWLKQFQVSGDREWRRGVGGWVPSSAKPFARMPVTYDRAFGGEDDGHSEPRNRSGMGFSTRRTGLEGKPLPNVEWPDALLKNPTDRPAPAGLGVIARHWMPRMQYAGTYDDAWLEHQFPLLPADFDDRFFHAAAEDQWIASPRGGEWIEVHGMSAEGEIRACLPDCLIPVSLGYADGEREEVMQTETVLIDALTRRCIVTWSAAADIHGDPFRLEEIAIGSAAASARAKAAALESVGG